MIESKAKNYYIKARLAQGEISYQPEIENSGSDTTVEVLPGTIKVNIESRKNVYFNLNKVPNYSPIHVLINMIDTLYINEVISAGLTLRSNYKGEYGSINRGAIILSNSEIQRFEGRDLLIKDFIIKNSSISDLNFCKSKIYGKLTIDTCSVDNINFEYTGLPDTVVFGTLDLRRVKNSIDLTTAYNSASSETKSVLVFANTDLNRFRIPLDRFIIAISPSQSYEQKSMLYQQLLRQLENAGLTEQFEAYDKEFKQIKLLHNNSTIINWMSKIWWDYGYDKAKVIQNSIIIFALFFLLNLLNFRLLTMVYHPIKFQENKDRFSSEYQINRNGKKYIVEHVFHVFLYTSYLFWGLKLDLKEIEIRLSFAIFWIIIQYLSGIVCIAYIANFIITK